MNRTNPPAGPGRRAVLAGSAAGATALLIPAKPASAAPAARYPAAAFAQTNQAAALKTLFGQTPTASSDVKITAPDIAENGAVVPVKVDANMTDPTTVAILALDNPFTLAAAYKIPPGTSPTISSRLKLAKTTQVMAVYQGDGKLLSASRQVKVTLGGCG